MAGYDYGFFKAPAFNESVGAGAPGYDYPGWQIVTPIGYTADKGTGESRPTIGYEYKIGRNGYSREEVIADFAGVGGASTKGEGRARGDSPVDVGGGAHWCLDNRVRYSH